jgi:competence protein ComEC
VAIGVLARVHDGVVEKIDKTFGDPHAALLAGLLLGDQRFSDAWEEKFQATGTTHIVAASGYNVTVVSFILFGFLVYFGVRRQQAYGILLVGIIAYVFLAGGDAPVVRAGVMGSLVLTSKQLGRKTTMTNVLLLAAVLMLIPEPRLLRDDVGFQLSMLATIGLIYFAPTVDKWFSFVPKTFTLRESLSATVAATIFTLPIILFSFGNLSLVSPIANLLILPVIPYAMAFGAIALVIGFVSAPVGALAAGPAWALLTYVLWVIESLASLPFVNIAL